MVISEKKHDRLHFISVLNLHLISSLAPLWPSLPCLASQGRGCLSSQAALTASGQKPAHPPQPETSPHSHCRVKLEEVGDWTEKRMEKTERRCEEETGGDQTGKAVRSHSYVYVRGRYEVKATHTKWSSKDGSLKQRQRKRVWKVSRRRELGPLWNLQDFPPCSFTASSFRGDHFRW